MEPHPVLSLIQINCLCSSDERVKVGKLRNVGLLFDERIRTALMLLG